MKVFYHGRSNNHRLYVTPAEHYPHVSAWREEDGRPKQFEVHFTNGETDVDDNLGAYMVEKNIASATKIITNVQGAA